jgi:arginyl-tRNA synthetase
MRWPRCSNTAGHKVIREYYVNDAGAQVDVLARSVHIRYREALGEMWAIPKGFIPAIIWCRSGRHWPLNLATAYAEAPEANG